MKDTCNRDGGEQEDVEMENFHRKLLQASLEAQDQKVNGVLTNQGTSKLEDYSLRELPIVPYVKPVTVDVERISRVMARMHMMTATELRNELKFFHIDSRGKRTVLYERLKKFIRKECPKDLDSLIPHRGKTERFFDYLIVIDFECTCDEIMIDFPHEIIEFPAILVNVSQKQIVDSFRSFVRPVLNPVLNDFCMNLTGITQEDVGRAQQFVEVFDSFRNWLSKNIGSSARYAYVTDGPWDIAKFFQMQCIQSKIPLPHDFRHYVNIRKSFMHKYHRKGGASQKTSLNGMLSELEMEFEGREHSGIDDSRNIARILLRLLNDNAEIRVNERLMRRKANEKVRDLDNLSREDAERAMWRNTLPYKVVLVNRESFVSGDYLDCESCSENTS